MATSHVTILVDERRQNKGSKTNYNNTKAESNNNIIGEISRQAAELSPGS